MEPTKFKIEYPDAFRVSVPLNVITMTKFKLFLDESCIAPFTFDLLRSPISVLVADSADRLLIDMFINTLKSNE